MPFFSLYRTFLQISSNEIIFLPNKSGERFGENFCAPKEGRKITILELPEKMGVMERTYVF